MTQRGSKLGRATADMAAATGRSRAEFVLMLAAGLAAGGVAVMLGTLKVLDALGSDITHRPSARVRSPADGPLPQVARWRARSR